MPHQEGMEGQTVEVDFSFSVRRRQYRLYPFNQKKFNFIDIAASSSFAWDHETAQPVHAVRFDWFC
jgi:hypothetical protein